MSVNGFGVRDYLTGFTKIAAGSTGEISISHPTPELTIQMSICWHI